MLLFVSSSCAAARATTSVVVAAVELSVEDGAPVLAAVVVTEAFSSVFSCLVSGTWLVTGTAVSERPSVSAAFSTAAASATALGASTVVSFTDDAAWTGSAGSALTSVLAGVTVVLAGLDGGTFSVVTATGVSL